MNRRLASVFRRGSADRPFRCRDVARVLQPYLDGETDDATVQLVRDHLDACRDCGLEAATFDQLKASLAVPGSLPADALGRLARFADELASDGIAPDTLDD